MKMRRIVAGILGGLLVLNGNYMAVQAAETDDAVTDEEAVEFYVSPDGDDSNPGSENAPFQSLSRAKQAVDEINDDMSSDIIVYLMDGVYYQDETLTFGTQDSGTNGYKVRYEAYPGAAPEISGGQELDGEWELYDEENNIYRISVPEGVNFRQLYVNGEKGIRARTGADRVFDSTSRICGADRLDEEGNVIPEWWSATWDPATQVQAAGGRVIVPDDGRISEDMKNLQEVELHIYTAWVENILRIESIEKIDSYDCQQEAVHTGKEIDWDGACWRVYVQEPEAERIFNRPHPGLDNYTGGPHYAFYYENAYEYIDEDTEWYLDRGENTLYYKAPADMDMASASAVIPMVEEIVTVEGTLDNPVHDIEFRGITFEHSTWLTPSEEGIVGGQANQDMTYGVFKDNNVGVRREGTGIHIRNAQNIRFDGNTIRFMGATGILVDSGTEGVVLINNTVEETAGNGIELGKFVVDENTDYHQVYVPEDERELCKNNRILNNVVHAVGTQYDGAVGIAAGYVQGITIANNTIYDCPYSGISVGYGWTSSENPMKYNKILNNEIYAVNQIVCDGGGIYTLSNQTPGSYIRGNYLHDNLLPADADYGAAGIYLDEATSGYTVNENVLVSSYDIILHIAGENQIGNNYIYTGSSDEAGYADFVTEEVRNIMDHAGVQEDFDENAFGEAEIDSAVYDPWYGCLEIAGMGFGQEKGAVCFETDTETIILEDSAISGWDDHSVRAELPEQVKTGDRVYISLASGGRTDSFTLGQIESALELTAEEDFEAEQEGGLSDSSWEISIPEKAAVASDEQTKYMQLTGNSTNLDVTRKGEDGNILKFGDNVTQFDFRFPEALSDYAGLYNVLAQPVGSDKLYTVNIRPTWSMTIALEEKTVGETGNSSITFTPGEWYTCRTMKCGNVLYAGFFKKGDAEPSGWELRRRISENTESESILNFSFYDSAERLIDIDNIKVWFLTEPQEEEETVSKKTLEYFLNSAKTHQENGDVDDCVASVRQLFAEAIAQGEAVMAKEDATVEEVNRAALKLMDAIQALDMKAGDKTDLEMALKLTETIDLTKYVEKGQEEYLAAKETADAVMADGDAMQQEVDEAWNALVDALNNLRLKADKSVLEELLNSVEGLDLSVYTDESVQVYTAALVQANAVLEDPALSEDDQDQVDQAVEELRKAKETLQLKEDPQDPSEPQNPEDPDNPENPGDSEEPQDPENPGESQDPEDSGNPEEPQNPDGADEGDGQDIQGQTDPDGSSQDPTADDPDGTDGNADSESDSGPGDYQAVKTGDDMEMMPWLCIAGLSIVLMAAGFRRKPGNE